MLLKRRHRGQSIIETVVGIIFLIPVVLFLFDIAALVLCSSANDNLAKAAARAAASAVAANGQGNATVAREAAKKICNNFAVSQLIQKPPSGGIDGTFMTGFHFNSRDGATPPNPAPPAEGTDTACADGQVCVVTTMDVKVPVPFGPFTGSPLRSRAVEPVVSVSP